MKYSKYVKKYAHMKISPTTCLRAYNPNFYLDMDGEARICCKQDINFRFKPDSDKSTKEYFSKIRRSMEKGEKHPSCISCYDIEKLWTESARTRFNKWYINNNNNKGNDSIKARYLEINFSNICNLACRMCCSRMSTGRIMLDKHIGSTIYSKTSLPEDVINFIYKKNNIIDLNHIEIKWWEPLLEKEHYKFLIFLIESWFSKHIELWYSSNLTILPIRWFKIFPNWYDDIFKIWEKFKKIKMRVSIDWYKEVDEYIRIGTNWKEMINNINQLQKRDFIHLTISSTIQIDNIFNLPYLILFCIKNNLDIHLNSSNYVYFPKYYCIQNIPSPIKKKINKLYKNFIAKTNLPKRITWELISILDFMNEKQYDKKEFLRYVNITQKTNDLYWFTSNIFLENVYKK